MSGDFASDCRKRTGCACRKCGYAAGAISRYRYGDRGRPQAARKKGSSASRLSRPTSRQVDQPRAADGTDYGATAPTNKRGPAFGKPSLSSTAFRTASTHFDDRARPSHARTRHAPYRCAGDGEALGAADYDALLDMLPDIDERLFANLDAIDEGFDDWLAIERTRQQEVLVTLIADASAAALAQGQTRHARMLHARLLEFDPEAHPAQPGTPSAPAQAAPALSKAAHVPNGLKSPSRYGTKWLLGAALLLLALLAGGIWYLNRAPASAATVVVLPFKGLPSQNASFAEGLSDEITAQLARQPGLRVAGRTSAGQFRNGNANLAQIGQKLGVSYALEGTVRSVANRVRVNVALTKTSDGMQLWSNTFDGSLDDVLAIQYRIGESVASALKLRLAGGGVPTGSLATNGQVYGLYLSARGLIRERNPKAFGAARERLLRAVKLDPNFAPAWSSLAQVENPGGLGPEVREQTERARAYAQMRSRWRLTFRKLMASWACSMVRGPARPRTY